ncbi:MAG TPA: hypothetical protein VGV89_03040 [Thermoplasmata archaeon]|nr:hypothetical protein [Thermoplasmata archaeon]
MGGPSTPKLIARVDFAEPKLHPGTRLEPLSALPLKRDVIDCRSCMVRPSLPTPVLEISVPAYRVDREPDFTSIGLTVDRAIEGLFPDGRYILRAIGLDDHPGQSLETLTQIVLSAGTDKYDPSRRAVGHDEFSGYDYDVQAGPIEIRDSRLVLDSEDKELGTLFGSIARHFYHGARIDRGHPVRIDLLMLYDPQLAVRARRTHPGAKRVRPSLSRHLYKFKEPMDKRVALRGLVRILR